jgi:hypothetical protein
MRRTHLRGRDNIRKRILIHASAFNLSLVLRGMFRVGTPRGFQRRDSIIISNICAWMAALLACLGRGWSDFRRREFFGDDKCFAGHGPLLWAA